MKHLLIFSLFLCINATGQDFPYQKVFVIDSLMINYDVREYTLNAEDLYGINRNVELYNIPVLNGAVWLVFSLLPEYKNNRNWKKIDYNEISGKVASSKNLLHQIGVDFMGGEVPLQTPFI